MLNENYQIWTEGIERVKFTRGILPTETDILIIGGGVTGIISAYLLSKENKKVLLLEKKYIGESVTDCTTGFLTGVIDTDPIKLIKVFGQNKAKLILASHFEAINEVEKIINLENIECEFERCTNYIYANNKKEEKDLLELATAYKKLGVEVLYKNDNNLKFNKFGYLEMPNHAKFHVMKYVYALAKIATKNGVIISENTEVIGLENHIDCVNVEIKDLGFIKSKKVVSATYLPFNPPQKLAHLCNMYREYVIEYKLPTDTLTIGTYEDMMNPYHYFRIDKKNTFDRLIIGGADHLDVIKMDRAINYQSIREYAKKLFLGVNIEEVRYWSGLILETNDGLAYAGELEGENIFYIFGFSGNGMTYSYIAGKIFLDKILSRENNYTDIYNLNRKISWWKKIYLK